MRSNPEPEALADLHSEIHSASASGSGRSGLHPTQSRINAIISNRPCATCVPLSVAKRRHAIAWGAIPRKLAKNVHASCEAATDLSPLRGLSHRLTIVLGLTPQAKRCRRSATSAVFSLGCVSTKTFVPEHMPHVETTIATSSSSIAA